MKSGGFDKKRYFIKGKWLQGGGEFPGVFADAFKIPSTLPYSFSEEVDDQAGFPGNQRSLRL